MKNIIPFLFVCLMMNLFSSCQQTAEPKRETILKNFLSAVAQNKMGEQEIFEHYFDFKLEYNQFPEDEKQFLQAQIKWLRKELGSKPIDQLKIMPYSKVSVKEKNIVLSDEQIQDVFVIYGQNGEIFSALFHQGKIASITTMNKGMRKVFVML